MTKQARPHLCKGCGKTDPECFYPTLKSACKSCHNAKRPSYRVNKGKKKDAYDKLTTELQEEFISEIHTCTNAVLKTKYNIPINLISRMRKAEYV